MAQSNKFCAIFVLHKYPLMNLQGLLVIRCVIFFGCLLVWAFCRGLRFLLLPLLLSLLV